MNVRVEVLFESPNEDAQNDLRLLGCELTDDPSSVRVFPLPDKPGWLVVEFTRLREAQPQAVDKIDRLMRFYVWEYLDSVIRFPKTAAERALADRKNVRRRVRRREKKQ